MEMDIGPTETITDEMIDALSQPPTINQTNSPSTGSIPAKNSVISEVEVVDQSNLPVTEISPLPVILPAILSLVDYQRKSIRTQSEPFLEKCPLLHPNTRDNHPYQSVLNFQNIIDMKCPFCEKTRHFAQQGLANHIGSSHHQFHVNNRIQERMIYLAKKSAFDMAIKRHKIPPVLPTKPVIIALDPFLGALTSGILHPLARNLHFRERMLLPCLSKEYYRIFHQFNKDLYIVLKYFLDREVRLHEIQLILDCDRVRWWALDEFMPLVLGIGSFGESSYTSRNSFLGFMHGAGFEEDACQTGV
jgi:hypothetical protein